MCHAFMGKISQTVGSTKVDNEPGHSSEAALDSESMCTTRIYEITSKTTTRIDIPCNYETSPPAPLQGQVHLSEFGPTVRNGGITFDYGEFGTRIWIQLAQARRSCHCLSPLDGGNPQRFVLRSA